jgi:nucleoside-diphosphate-sugar epimerase
MTNRPRVLIAGITGFLGSRLARHLVASGNYTVIGMHRAGSDLRRLRDILDQIALYNIEKHESETLLRKQQLDFVVSCVADYGRNKSALDVMRANVIFPLQLLEASVEHGVKVFINAGTSLPADLNSYALSKHQFSQWLAVFGTQLAAIDLKLEHFYGPGESTERFISYVIAKLLEPAPKLDLTKGEQKRDFLHVDDVVRAIVLLIDREDQWNSGYYQFPVGSGQAHLLKDVVEQIRRLTSNHSTNINYGALPYRANEVMESRADIRNLRELGWEPVVSLDEGLRQTVDSFRQSIEQRIAG